MRIFARFRFLVLVAAACIAAGCAGTSVTHYAADGSRDGECTGIRFYQNAHFILVYSSKGHYVSKHLTLPDTTIIHSARPYEYLANNELDLSLKDGVMTDSAGTSDSTKIPQAVIQAARDAAIQALKLSAAGNKAELREDPEAAPKVYLYKIVADSEGNFSLIGDSSEIDIKIN